MTKLVLILVEVGKGPREFVFVEYGFGMARESRNKEVVEEWKKGILGGIGRGGSASMLNMSWNMVTW